MSTPPPLPRRGIPWALKLVIAVVLLGAAFSVYTIFHLYHGFRSWKSVEEELAAKGESLYLPDLAPPPVPDEENFFADPVWKFSEKPDGKSSLAISSFIPPLTEEENQRLADSYPSLDWRPKTDHRIGALQAFRPSHKQAPEKAEAAAHLTLEILSQAAPLIDKLDALLTRPQARYPANYEAGLTVSLPHVTELLKLSQLFMLRAQANLVLGQTDAAFQDIRRIDRLQKTIIDEPSVISALVRVAIISCAREAAFEGLKRHSWSDEQLKQLEELAANQEILSRFPLAIRGDRAALNISIGNSTKRQGSYAMRKERAKAAAWLFQCEDRALTNRLIQDWLELLESPEAMGYPRNTKVISQLNDNIKKPLGNIRFYYSRLSLPGVFDSEDRMLHVDISATQLQTACALERYWLKHGQYPESLSALVPDYLSALPLDLIDNLPLRYNRSEPEKYILYSIGADRVDDGGRSGTLTEGDWVWGTPVKRSSR